MQELQRPRVGDEHTLKCDALGAKGDGIFHIGRFVLIVPDTKERLFYHVKVTRVLDKVAFGESLGEATHG